MQDDVLTMLYRIFDENNNLLYIGISQNIIRRLSSHMDTKWWWNEIADGALRCLRRPPRA
jgi:hypothetical protein